MTVATQLTYPQILRKAAHLIETSGLAQGILYHRGKFCAIGAIGKAVYDDPMFDQALLDDLFEKIRQKLMLPLTGIDTNPWVVADWSNAAAAQGKPHIVIDGFRKVADLLEA